MRSSFMGKQVFQISLFGILLFIANADIATAASGEPCQLDALIFRDIKSNFLNKKNIVSWPYPTESGPKCPAFGDQLCKPASRESFCIPSNYSCCGETLCSATEKCCGGGCCPKSSKCIEGMGCCSEGKTCASNELQIMTIMQSDLSAGPSQISTVSSSAFSTFFSVAEEGAKASNAANATKTVTMHITDVVTLDSPQEESEEATVSVMNSKAGNTITQTTYATVFNDMSRMCSDTSILLDSSNVFISRASSMIEASTETATNIKCKTAGNDIASYEKSSETTATKSSMDASGSVTDAAETASIISSSLDIDSAKPTLCYDSYMNRLEPCSSDNNYSAFEGNSTTYNSTGVQNTYLSSDIANEGHRLSKGDGFSFMAFATVIILQILFSYNV